MHDQQQIRELCLRWEEAADRGEQLSPEELCADAPALLDEVRRQIGDLRAMKRLLTPTRPCPLSEEPAVSTRPPTKQSLPNIQTPTVVSANVPLTVPFPPPPSPGWPTIPGYEILGELGKGGMGVVYKARQNALNRLVALKMMLPNRAGPEELSRFRIEAEAIARLQHPNIVQIHEIGAWNGQPFFSLEYVEGGSLDRRCAATPQPPQAAARVVFLLTQAMEEVHRKGIIHRDLKPANVLLAGAPEAALDTLTPKISDFGLAKRLDADGGQTRAGAIFGTPNYMAPEQADGRLKDICPATDVYALGAILYELLTGQPPFKGASLNEILRQVREQEPVSPRWLQPRCPRDLETICVAALQKDVRARYPSARALGDDLQRYLDGRPIMKRPVGRLGRFVKWVKRAPFQAAALAATVGFVGMGTVAQYRAAALAREQAANAEFKLGQSNLLARISQEAHTAFQRQDWETAHGKARDGLRLIDEVEFLRDHQPRAPLEHIRHQARGKLDEAAVVDNERRKLARFHQLHSRAVYFATPFTGLELADNLERVKTATHEALALFQVRLDTAEDSPPVIHACFEEGESRSIKELCVEVLIVYADALTQISRGERDERERLERALKLLDRADQLGGGPTSASQVVRAGCRERLQLPPEAAQDKRPQTAVDYFLRGLVLYRRGDFAAAVPWLADALKRHPGHYGAEYLLAVCRARLGQFQPAREGLTRCLTSRPESDWPRLLLGFAEMKLANYEEARHQFDRILQSDRADEDARYVATVNRGVLAVQRQQWRAGEADFQAAIGLRPQVVYAPLNLALLHKAEAEQDWREQLLGLGTDPLGLERLAWRLPKWRAAIVCLDRAIAARPNVRLLHQERGGLLAKVGEVALARQDLETAVRLAPTRDDPGLLADSLALGWLLFEAGEYARVVGEMDLILAVPKREHALAWYLKGKSLNALKEYKGAGEALSRYLEYAPAKGHLRLPEETVRLQDAFALRGLLHVKMNDFLVGADRTKQQQDNYTAALACYTRGLALGEDVRLLSLRGRTYLTLHSPLPARTDLEKVVALRPTDGEGHLRLALALVELKDCHAALERARRGLALAVRGQMTHLLAAQVFSRAERQLAGEKVVPSRQGGPHQLGLRAVEQLRLALPNDLEERRTFWNRYIEEDPSMVYLTRTVPAMRNLRDALLLGH